MLGNFYHMGGYDGMSGLGYQPWGMGLSGLVLAPFMLLLVVWTFYWKYHALWYAAKHDHKWWFIALLVINTLGILEILYLKVFSKNVETLSHDEKSVPMVPPHG